MGKRKAAKKVQGPKKREPLATIFPCLFCNHEKSCHVNLDKKTMKGILTCKVCGQSNVTEINYLSAAVDVYADWVDKCDEAARLDREEQAARAASSSQSQSQRQAAPRERDGGRGGRRDEYEDEDAEGEYDDDVGEGRGYEGEGVVADDDDY